MSHARSEHLKDDTWQATSDDPTAYNGPLQARSPLLLEVAALDT